MEPRRNDAGPGAVSERPIVKPTNEARQAVAGHKVRYVLAWSLVAVIIAFALIYIYYVA
jgi:hypothetical protein